MRRAGESRQPARQLPAEPLKLAAGARVADAGRRAPCVRPGLLPGLRPAPRPGRARAGGSRFRERAAPRRAGNPKIRSARGSRVKVGVAGTGMLGAAVARRLLDRGAEVSVWNRTRGKAEALAAAGARVAPTPGGAAAGCDAVITCVRDGAAVREVAFGAGGIALGPDRPAVCDMSTITPEESRRVSAGYAARGFDALAAPVMGGPDAAAEGRLVVMASGSAGAFKRCGGALEAVADRIFYLGGAAGAAHSVKLAMNLQIAALALSLSEGIALARGASVDPKSFLEVLNATYFGTGMSRKKAYRMIEGRFEPTFTLGNLGKDLRAATETARSLGLELPLCSLAEGVYARAEEGGLGGLDYTGILRHVEGLGREPPRGAG